MLTVSVVLCTFNGERFLSEQLASIMAQTHLPDEVVIRDDGSTDQTMRILRAWAEKAPFPVKIHQNVQNLGPAKNFEAAVQEAEKEIVFFCDQDDIWKPEKIARVLEVFESEPETGVVYHNTEVINADGEKMGLDEIRLRFKISQFTASRYLAPTNERDPIVSGCCCAARRAFLEKVTPFFCEHDISIYSCARAVDQIKTLREALIFYRFHQNNASLCETLEKQRFRDDYLEKNIFRLEVPLFWGHYATMCEFQKRVEALPDAPGKRKMLHFLKSTTSHLINRSRIQRNLFFFFPLLVFELLGMRYFRREMPLRSIFYDVKRGFRAGLGLKVRDELQDFPE
ncbi:MAG: glycosyltransferase family 2 protein [Thermoguttaceae bacterium]|nr:glycosyltransferase family 2 protein [Thermoguttaceae bacterium]